MKRLLIILILITINFNCFSKNELDNKELEILFNDTLSYCQKEMNNDKRFNNFCYSYSSCFVYKFNERYINGKSKLGQYKEIEKDCLDFTEKLYNKIYEIQ